MSVRGRKGAEQERDDEQESTGDGLGGDSEAQEGRNSRLVAQRVHANGDFARDVDTVRLRSEFRHECTDLGELAAAGEPRARGAALALEKVEQRLRRKCGALSAVRKGNRLVCGVPEGRRRALLRPRK
eukprot:6190659-Pleurochrysis_carterae.AAC.1